MIRSPLGLRVSTSARRRLVAAGAGTVLVLCAALAAPMAASAYDPADYPSWSDVEAAKSSESATAAEVDRITAILADLRDQAAVLTDAAISRAAEADAAQSALDEATQRVTALEERAAAARADADAAKEQAGRLAAQLYRNGGTDATLNLLVGGEQSDQLLYRLGTMSQLTLQTSRLQDDAETTENAAASLAEQAEQARTERLSLVSAAQDALATAQAAQSEADAKVADQEQYSAGLYEQLASLKNTTAALGTYAGRTDGMSPAQAQNYARSVMGVHGWGQDQADSCLIPLWNGESGWRWNALNRSSGAYGIPQALPASKMATYGADYQTNAATQIDWGLAYISDRYGSPCAAWSAWNNRSPHWY